MARERWKSHKKGMKVNLRSARVTNGSVRCNDHSLEADGSCVGKDGQVTILTSTDDCPFIEVTAGLPDDDLNNDAIQSLCLTSEYMLDTNGKGASESPVVAPNTQINQVPAMKVYSKRGSRSTLNQGGAFEHFPDIVTVTRKVQFSRHGGCGLRFGSKDDSTITIDIIEPDSPFRDSILECGMQLLSVNGWKASGKSLEEITRLLHATADGTVTVEAHQVSPNGVSSSTRLGTNQVLLDETHGICDGAPTISEHGKEDMNSGNTHPEKDYLRKDYDEKEPYVGLGAIGLTVLSVYFCGWPGLICLAILPAESTDKYL